MDDDARVGFEVRDGVATITINSPDRGNALDAAMLRRLEALLVGLTPEARVVLVRGAGPRSFCTGYFLPALLEELKAGASVADFEDHPLERALRALEAVAVPTIAVVQGHAYGAGFELALACDLRLASSAARFCMPPARLGLLYSATGMRRLRELVGPALAKELFFTAEPVESARALSIGLVNQVVAPDALDARATELAAQVADNAALSIRHTKTVFDRYLGPSPLTQEDMRAVAALREECFKSPEFAERAARAIARPREGQTARLDAGKVP